MQTFALVEAGNLLQRGCSSAPSLVSSRPQIRTYPSGRHSRLAFLILNGACTRTLFALVTWSLFSLTQPPILVTSIETESTSKELVYFVPSRGTETFFSLALHHPLSTLFPGPGFRMGVKLSASRP